MLYVLPFYFSPKTRPSPRLNRDAPSVIQARVRAVTTTTIISTVATFYLLHNNGQLNVESALHHVGIWPVSLIAILKSLLLTCILFLGPLYNDIYLQGSLSPAIGIWSRLVTCLSSSIGYRNYVAGPVTEELLFRSTILGIHLLSPLAESPNKLVFLTPLYFGIAHVHHFYEFRLTHPDMALMPALLRTIIQFGYTTIFGWYASFVYLRTGSLYSVCILHTFCNYMGLPRFWGRVKLRTGNRPYGATQLGPVIRGKDDSGKEPLAAEVNNDRGALMGLDKEIVQTVVYYVLLLAGAYMFTRCLFPMTDFKTLQLAKFKAEK